MNDRLTAWSPIQIGLFGGGALRRLNSHDGLTPTVLELSFGLKPVFEITALGTPLVLPDEIGTMGDLFRRWIGRVAVLDGAFRTALLDLHSVSLPLAVSGREGRNGALSAALDASLPCLALECVVEQRDEETTIRVGCECAVTVYTTAHKVP